MTIPFYLLGPPPLVSVSKELSGYETIRRCPFVCVFGMLASDCPSFPGRYRSVAERDTVQVLRQGNGILSQDPRHPTTPFVLFIHFPSAELPERPEGGEQMQVQVCVLGNGRGRHVGTLQGMFSPCSASRSDGASLFPPKPLIRF